ncbi:MAG: branched-chain amino acid ABC transporter permease [Desulfatiglans sp.]|jgi:branched-subunit amino acid ABC-type transport system permease component|nr:branched-chain amino acid ABC transporter permease [Thermodesulfobacteriota bacterium]MEE4353321.1 branched-chain amino acid ABC transporter permease [Desulfatiglans sp.]
MAFDSSMLFIQFVSGLSRAMVLFLMASGLTLIFGVMKVINFAHGVFYMLGAYIAFTLTALLTGPLGFWAAIVIAPTVVALIGGLVEIILLRRIYEKEHLLQILLTYSLIFVFNDAVKLLWGEEMRIVSLPKILSGFVTLFSHRFPIYYFFIITIGILVALLLWVFLSRTRIGKVLRAAAEHKDMVALLGYDVGGLFTVVFIIATWLGGLAGAVIAPTVRLSLGMDMEIIIECFIVAIVGGLGSIWGALLGALITGQIYAFGILIVPNYAMAFLFALAALIIIFRPNGLLGKPLQTG